MKRNLKIGLALVLALLQLFLLCGCDALDEMRKNQAFIDEENGNITWNGTVYKPLSYCEYLTVEPETYTYVYATAADVPVLLSEPLSSRTLVPSDDAMLLYDLYYNVYYCREADFDAFSARIDAPFEPDIVCYSYMLYNEDYELETKYYILTREQIDAIEMVVQNTEPTELGEGIRLNSDYSIYLEECSEDMLLRRSSMDISVSGSTYYLHLYTDDGQVLFTVPDGCNDTFAEIVKAYVDAENTFQVNEDLNSI